MRNLLPILKRVRASQGGIKWHFVASLILKLGQVAFTFAVTLLLARTLSTEDFGFYAYAYALITLLSIPAQFGLSNLVLREVAQGRAQDRWSHVKGIVLWAFGLSGVLSLLVSALGGVISWLWGSQLTSLDQPTFMWGLLLLPFIVFTQILGAILRAFKKTIWGLLIQQTLRPILFLTLIALVLAFLHTSSGEYSARTAMALHAIATICVVLFGAVLLARTWPNELREIPASYQHRYWLKSVLPFAAIGGLTLINQNTDILMLGALTTPEDVGIYRIAVQMASLVAIGLQAVNMVVAPRFAELYATGNHKLLERTVRNSVRATLLLTLPATILLWAFGRPILGTVFGSEYAAGYLPLCILVFGQLANALVGSVGFLLNMTGHERDTVTGVSIAAISNIICNLLLIPLFGIIGAAVATAVSMCLWNGLLWFAVKKRLGINSFAFSGIMPRKT